MIAFIDILKWPHFQLKQKKAELEKTSYGD